MPQPPQVWGEMVKSGLRLCRDRHRPRCDELSVGIDLEGSLIGSGRIVCRYLQHIPEFWQQFFRDRLGPISGFPPRETVVLLERTEADGRQKQHGQENQHRLPEKGRFSI